MDRGIFITWEFWRDKSTTYSEKVLLLEINNLSMLEHGCVASNRHLAEQMGIKKEAVSRLINSLVKKGFIETKIKNGSRNFSRQITINKLLFDPKQIVISPLTNCSETKGNKTSNKTINYQDFIDDLKSRVNIKSKVTNTKEGEILFESIKDIEQLKLDYIYHQKEKKDYAKRITAFMEDYNPNIDVSDEWRMY
jgi:DNA-binding Lrp family transcriptional regulator